MKIMLDCSPAKIFEYRERYDYDFWQLRTPLTAYARAEGIPYGLDNGCFTKFDEPTWKRLLHEARDDKPVFATLPDVVGSAQRTIELFKQFRVLVFGLPRALVLQDGIENVEIEWHTLDAVFIGGSDAFKISKEAFQAAKAAKIMKKWVHVGRVNTAARVEQWIDLADSIDGSGISRYDHMLENVMNAISRKNPQVSFELN